MCRLVIKERVGRGERKSGRSEVDRCKDMKEKS